MRKLLAFFTLLYAYVIVAVDGSDNSVAYPCNVPDCQRCSGPNFCGLCKP